jgi:hypothetical protein
MSDAIGIERLQDLFASWRRRIGESQAAPERPASSHIESPREMEQQTIERLYGDRSNVVVHAAGDRDDPGA